VSFRVAEEHHLALPPSDCASTLAAHASALQVVGGDEADVVVAFQPRVEDDDGDFFRARFLDRLHERRLVERREADPRDAAAHRVLDLRDLRVAVVFAQRSAPDDVHAELGAGLLGARPDALPEHVRRALRDHGDRE
jgi:hypothetical protein